MKVKTGKWYFKPNIFKGFDLYVEERIINDGFYPEYSYTQYRKGNLVDLCELGLHNDQNKPTYFAKWFQKNKEIIKEKNKIKYKEDINYRLIQIIRINILQSIQKTKKTKSSIKLLGCDIKFYKEYLESKFLPEMSWENHGVVWEIDHIIPCSSFDLTIEQNQLICFNYKNTQPLFKTTQIAESFGYTDQIGNRNKLNKI